jgi:hypothetical protein
VDEIFSVSTVGDGTGKILIQGDSKQAFRMGLAYDRQFFLNFLGNSIPAQNATTSPNIASLASIALRRNNFFSFFRPGQPLVYGSPEFPKTASGLVGTIQIGLGSNTSIYSSVQSRTFDPAPVKPPVVVQVQPPQVQPPVVVQVQPPVVVDPPVVVQPPPQPNFSANAATQNASTVAQRDPKTGQLLCPSGTSTTNIALRSAPATQPVPSDPAQPSTQTLQPQPIDPCQKPQYDDTLFKLLYENPNVQGIQELMPADIKQKK